MGNWQSGKKNVFVENFTYKILATKELSISTGIEALTQLFSADG